MSSSRISPIKNGQTLKGVVVDDPAKYRIYELWVSPLQMEEIMK
jgi:hypothetical protein